MSLPRSLPELSIQSLASSSKGILLEEVWPNMVIEKRFVVIKSLARYQKAWSSIRFNQCGILYYAQDINSRSVERPLYSIQDIVGVSDPNFVDEPTVGREWFDNGRAAIDFDRGPCKRCTVPHRWKLYKQFLQGMSAEAYEAAVGARENACVRKARNLPKSPITLFGPGTYIPSREKKLNALYRYLSVLKYLMPPDDSIATPHIWHGDLQVGNIFINPSQPTEIVGILDWQSTDVAPLYTLLSCLSVGQRTGWIVPEPKHDDLIRDREIAPPNILKR